MISGTQPEDSGTYVCVASNTAGNDTVEARVVITGG